MAFGSALQSFELTDRKVSFQIVGRNRSREEEQLGKLMEEEEEVEPAMERGIQQTDLRSDIGVINMSCAMS